MSDYFYSLQIAGRAHAGAHAADIEEYWLVCEKLNPIEDEENR